MYYIWHYLSVNQRLYIMLAIIISVLIKNLSPWQSVVFCIFQQL